MNLKPITSKTTKADLIQYIAELEAEHHTLVDTVDELENRVANLTLYLEYVRNADKKLWTILRKNFSGLPGFVSPKRKKVKQKLDILEGGDSDDSQRA